MVELLDLTPTDTIADPACGTSGFLVEAANYLKDRYQHDYLTNDPARRHFNYTAFTGYDMDRTMLRIGAMNMMTHGIDNPNIAYKDSLSDKNNDVNRYTFIYTEKNGLFAA
jgi:type I restriction enzyme M protein